MEDFTALELDIIFAEQELADAELTIMHAQEMAARERFAESMRK